MPSSHEPYPLRTRVILRDTFQRATVVGRSFGRNAGGIDYELQPDSGEPMFAVPADKLICPDRDKVVELLGGRP